MNQLLFFGGMSLHESRMKQSHCSHQLQCVGSILQYWWTIGVKATAKDRYFLDDIRINVTQIHKPWYFLDDIMFFFVVKPDP